jgi:hypothetical protein
LHSNPRLVGCIDQGVRRQIPGVITRCSISGLGPRSIRP